VNRRVALIAGGVGVAFLAVWFLLLWSPQGKRLDEAKGQREEAQSTNEELEVSLARLRDLEERRPQLEADLDALAAAVPETPDLATFILAADEAAERSGVDLNGVTPSKPTAEAASSTPTTDTTAEAAAGEAGATAAAPAAITLTLDATGGYFQALDFLNRLDDLPRVVVVDTLNLSSGGEGGDAEATGSTAELTISVSARMFTSEVPQDPAAEAGDTTATTAGASS